MSKKKPKPKKTNLGDSAENLTKVDSHKRVGGALRQKTWG